VTASRERVGLQRVGVGPHERLNNNENAL